jgi:hypothetical protein
MLRTSVNMGCVLARQAKLAKEASYKELPQKRTEASSSPHTFVLLGCETIRLTLERNRSRRRTLAGGFHGEAAEADRASG